MKNTTLAVLSLPVMLLSTCVDMTPCFADTAVIDDPAPSVAADDPAPTAKDVLAMMSKLPEEACLYNPKLARCARPAGFDHGPDAQRIAAAIAASADGRITGTRRGDAALMATFSSYESGNKADAIGDHGHSYGAFQIKFFGDSMLDPMRAAPAWIGIAVGSMKACAKNDPDERLASVAGSCTYFKARQKVRQRVKVARDVLAQIE